MRSLVSRSITSVVAAPPADAEGDAPGEPLVPGVAAAALASLRARCGPARRRYKSPAGHRPGRRVGPVGDRDQRLGLEMIPLGLSRPARPPRTFLFARRAPSRSTRR